MPGILVVEDDENLNRGITFSLKVNGRIRVPLQIADRFCGLFIFRWLFAAF